MNEPRKPDQKDPYAFPGPDDPPREWVREEAAYARERERLLREHLGKFVVVHQDEVFGPFDTYGEATLAACRRFGDAPLIVKQIAPEEPPDFVGTVDLRHPSIRLLEPLELPDKKGGAQGAHQAPLPSEKPMNESTRPEQKDPYAFPGPDDPPREWPREEAAYARERDRLVREHLGKFVVVHQDEVFGPFDTLGEAILAGYRRFGDAPMEYREIRPEEPPDFVSIVDVNHPSVRRVD